MVGGTKRDLLRLNTPVHKERTTQDIMKITARYAVNFLRTSAVEVPNSDSPGSPPKEAPKPRLLLS